MLAAPDSAISRTIDRTDHAAIMFGPVLAAGQI